MAVLFVEAHLHADVIDGSAQRQGLPANVLARLDGGRNCKICMEQICIILPKQRQVFLTHDWHRDDEARFEASRLIAPRRAMLLARDMLPRADMAVGDRSLGDGMWFRWATRCVTVVGGTRPYGRGEHEGSKALVHKYG